MTDLAFLESEVETVRSRGGRLPQDQPGSGLGLAIVGDLATAYGGSVCLVQLLYPPTAIEPNEH